MTDPINRYTWVDCVRSVLTVLVVGHHSALAYTTFANFESQRYIDSTHPIVDTQRNICLDIFQNFNDIFFMSLMFFIGGLFLHKSINKKGFKKFVKDRFYRLFMPFLFIGTFLMLIAHVPAYFMAHNSFDVNLYLVDFFIYERWPVGPPWFIWVLFMFNMIFAFLNKILSRVPDKRNLSLLPSNYIYKRPNGHFAILQSAYDKDCIYNARDYLIQNIQQPPSIAQLAKVCGINEFKLKKGFKCLFDKSIFGYLSDHKLNYARQLLLEGISIKAVAFQLGYSSVQHFSNAFRKKFAVPPGKVRV